MVTFRKLQIRVIWLAQILCGVGVFWDGLREKIFPTGATPMNLLIFYFLLFIAEGIISLKIRLQAE